MWRGANILTLFIIDCKLKKNILNSDKKRNLFLHFALKQSLMSQYNP